MRDRKVADFCEFRSGPAVRADDSARILCYMIVAAAHRATRAGLARVGYRAVGALDACNDCGQEGSP